MRDGHTTMRKSPIINRKQTNITGATLSLVKKAIPAGARDEEDDSQLLEGVSEGNHEAFAILVRRHSERFYRVAYRFTGRRTEAEDIVQDAFLKLWERPGLWQADRNVLFTTWFYRVVVNLCLDQHKKKRPLQLIDDTGIEDERITQEGVMLENERQKLLDKQIVLLPERQRIALNLCFYEGLSNQEAASIMGLRLKALQALIMRAKTTLKEQCRFMTES